VRIHLPHLFEKVMDQKEENGRRCITLSGGNVLYLLPKASKTEETIKVGDKILIDLEHYIEDKLAVAHVFRGRERVTTFGIGSQATIEGPLFETPTLCFHNHYNFGKHGRRCTCGKIMEVPDDK